MNDNLTNEKFALLRARSGLSAVELGERVGFSVRTIYRWERGESIPRKAVLEFLESVVRESNPGWPISRKFSFIDLFAGIGGLRRAFDSLGGECVFTSEWNRFAQKTYMANYQCSHEIAGDITKINEEDIPDHDILLAGFPCQPFSIAGVSKKKSLNKPHGFRCNAQGTLFFDVARIIEARRPKAFLLENVKNLVNHDKGRTFRVIRQTLEEELGYYLYWKVLDAKPWVPQHRERIFVAGFREPCDFTFENLRVPGPASYPDLSDILHPEDGSEPDELPYTTGIEAKVNQKYTLSDNLWTYLQAYARKHRAAGNGFGFGLVRKGEVARTLSARYYKDGSEILIYQGGKKNPRRLTPRECSRLMGFDKPGEATFNIPVSDAQAYRQFGNAVAVPCVESVAQLMINSLELYSSDMSYQYGQTRLPLFGRHR